jgi:hypothetical protein
MLTKFFAAWLAVLVVAPFTAPFSTCDLASVFATEHGTPAPAAPRPSVSSATDAAVPTPAFVHGTGRIRLLLAWRAPLGPSTAAASSSALLPAARPADRSRRHAGLAAVLRL